MKENKLKPCDCIIGEWIDFEDTKIITANELFKAVEENNHLYKKSYRVSPVDYCDFRKSVNFIRFMYCPFCGQKIDWKAMKRRAANESNIAID